jgi:hypothetical protein
MLSNFHHIQNTLEIMNFEYYQFFLEFKITLEIMDFECYPIFIAFKIHRKIKVKHKLCKRMGPSLLHIPITYLIIEAFFLHTISESPFCPPNSQFLR